jgi:putative toxin-antitoxin system antitoxin component (TIGR02293 family)
LTAQRLRASPNTPLSEDAEQIGCPVKILTRAVEIFASQEEAARWLEQPALGLDQQRPIDLLQTPAGVRLVEDFLGHLEYGVYNWPRCRRRSVRGRSSRGGWIKHG